MTVHAASKTYLAPRLSVAEAMSRGGFYPGHPLVTVCETHTASVFLAGDRAFKVKKPVRMEFLDFSTLERRYEACREEVHVNRELAAGLDMHVRAIVPLTESYVLVDAPNRSAVEYAIEMRRFDESRTMASLAQSVALTDEHVRGVARRIAGFHATARTITSADPVGAVMRASDRNLRELLTLADDDIVHRVIAAERFAAAFVVRHRAEIRARAERGSVRDCHGDLRAEHVVLEDPMLIIDRLEFDAHLREIDVADDLAFLAMDLEHLGAHDAARLLVAAYRDAGGDPGSDELLAFYGSYRALVRAKVTLLRAGQLDDPVAATGAREQADRLLDLADRFAWRARGPLVLAIGGPPASGKSTLAAALSQRAGLPVISSDAERKRIRGLSADATAPDAAYTPAARAEVYVELGARARAALAQGPGVIVDATFGDARLRAAFLRGLGGTERLLAIECQAAASVRDQRARTRAHEQAAGSDATPAVAAALGASYTGWDELSDEVILPLRSGVTADRLVDRIADFADTRSPLGFQADTRARPDIGPKPLNQPLH